MAVTSDEIATEIAAQSSALASWLSGEGPDAGIETFAAAHDPGFSMIDTVGEIVALPDVVDGLTAARGAIPGLRIDVRDVEILAEASGTVVVRFLEVHRLHDDHVPRRVTALLRRDPSAPRGFRWLHVHETPLPREA